MILALTGTNGFATSSAYREVPQASTGFSPFEMLYGHKCFTDQGRDEPINVVAYVVQVREKLERMSRLAQEHMAGEQQHQKTWYDQSARGRSFDPGQKMLVMLPME